MEKTSTTQNKNLARYGRSKSSKDVINPIEVNGLNAVDIETLKNNEILVKRFANTLPGNIHKSHGRNHVRILFWKFSGNKKLKKKTLNYIASLAKNKILTSALQQNIDSKTRINGKENLFVGLYLTPAGLKYFGWPTDNNGSLKDLIFRDDFPSVKNNQFKKEMHAILYLAYGSIDSDKDTLDGIARNYVKKFRKELKAIHVLNKSETGIRIVNREQQAIEAFGYPDGLSQPAFCFADLSGKSIEKWNPITSLEDEILVKEPITNSYGSYLAFLKIEQNVAAFRKMQKPIHDHLTADGSELTSTVGEMAIGRTIKGHSLASDATKVTRHITNDFNYDDDPNGLKCPLHAHARKVNPRSDSKGSLPIVRRGIPYGFRYSEYPKGTSNLPSNKVGLLFMSFQSNMDNFMSIWEKGIKPADSADPIIGYAEQKLSEEDKKKKFKHKYPKLKNGEIKLASANGFGGFTELKGGLQLYAPSIAFFESLDAGDKPDSDLMNV